MPSFDTAVGTTPRSHRRGVSALAFAAALLAVPHAQAASHAATPAVEGGFASQPYGERTGGEQLSAELIDADGNTVGRATFSVTPSGIVVVRAEASGLEAGEHGFHIHETGECDPATGFSSAGGHYAGEGDPSHGLVEGGPHAGDMANVLVGEDGVLAVEVFNPRISLTGGTNPLMDADGSALMVHSGADDYESQPSGDAGDRVVCGVITDGS